MYLQGRRGKSEIWFYPWGVVEKLILSFEHVHLPLIRQIIPKNMVKAHYMELIDQTYQFLPQNTLFQEKEDDMLIVHVFVHLKPDQIEAFKIATLENARNSKGESGIARFDVIQEKDDPTRFVLVEVYRSSQDPAKHKQTAHYQKWRDTVASMMAGPRTSITYTNVFPDEQGWD